MEEVVKQAKGLSLGDLVRVEWFDASIGKSLSDGLGGIDVPVQSWSIFLGVLDEKNKHIILAQNSFRYADGPIRHGLHSCTIAWTSNISTITKNHVPPEEAKHLLNSFFAGGKRTSICGTKQQKVRNHERLD